MKKTWFMFVSAIIAAAFLAVGNFAPQLPRAIAQGAIGIFANGVATGPSVVGQSGPQASGGLWFGSAYVGLSRHVRTGGVSVTPAVSSCGTTAALATGSTDTAGKITVGTSASNACTLTFGTAYTTAPFCIVQNKTTGAAANVYTVNTTTIVWSSALADSTELFYVCIEPA